MGRTFVSMVVLVAASFLAAPVEAASVSGSITYDGLPPDDVFADISGAVVFFVDHDSGIRTYGVIDQEAWTYVIDDLGATESGSVQIEVDRSQPGNGDGWDPGDLIATVFQPIGDPGGAYTLDLAPRYWLRFLSPYDSHTYSGNETGTCHVGPAAPSPTLVEWAPVPRAHSYSIVVRFQTCPYSILHTDVEDTTEPFVEVVQGLYDEDVTQVFVSCAGERSDDLCILPYVSYTSNTSTQAYLFHMGGGGGASRSLHPTGSRFVPAVASAAGAGDTYWSSQVVVVNRGSGPADLELFFTPRDADGTVAFDRATATVPAGGSLAWDDVLQQVFGTTGAGSVEIRGSGLVVDSRTSTPAAVGGSYGQGIPVLGSGDVLSTGGPTTAVAGGVVDDAAFRTNLGLCEVWGEPATVEITLFAQSGAELGSTRRTLRGFENLQINRVVRAILGQQQLSDGIVEVRLVSGSGRVGAYVSIVDNRTDDPTYRLLRP